jgi:hypothetical protein
MICLSEDDDTMATHVRSVNEEALRFYSKWELQSGIRSECEVTPVKN